MSNKKIAYIYSNNLRKQCDKLPTMRYRASIVQDLINCYCLMNNENVQIISPTNATYSELTSFHDSSYIDYVKTRKSDRLDKNDESTAESFGLLDDCPLLDNTYEFISTIAGGSIKAVQLLNAGRHQYVINWFGGWHHAQKSKAEGFCYVNDIVLAIKHLNFNKIMYIDLDVHHGDGVEKAFEESDKVLTLSIHKCTPGFYPGTGSFNEDRSNDDNDAANYSINVPLLDGIGDKTYEFIFKNVFNSAYEAFKPDCMVVQCGADILAGDPLGECNVTIETMGVCIQNILSREIPTVFLGGGGYKNAIVARYWTYLTSLILNVELNEDIPDTTGFFSLYTPTFELKIDAIMGRKDYNTKEYLEELVEKINKICLKINDKVN